MTTSFTTGVRRRQNLRLVLFVIILATLPFYCAGIFLWGSAPQTGQRPTATPTSPGRATVTPLATRTPLGGFTPGVVPTLGLLNTPGQFFPTTGPAVQPTFNFQPTATLWIPPENTIAPSLTPVIIPTATNPPPVATDTALPFPTDIPDSDGDGLPDNFDPCPGVPWPETGCPPTETPTETLIPAGP